MPKINVLGFDVANLIAAGEVVDRPASAVKELVENSIDAGATVITVEIKSGGTRSIRVSDNGCGIDGDDLPLTVLRHATSKISTAKDLAAIGTLGFRGEALAAIAAVTKLRIFSKVPGEPMGNLLQCDGGEIISFTQTGCSDGTTVVAEELFYNVPARRKFLKKDASETAAVTASIEKIALSAPGISIKYIADGEVRFMTAGDGNLYNAIYAVLGKQIALRTLPVDRSEGGIRVSGYISEPDFVKSKRTLEMFFINGRYVISRTAAAALEQAYSTRIPNEKFPLCVLNIELNPEAVDVNVHPSKLEVKFSNDRLVFEAVYYAVLTSLESSGTRPELMIDSTAKKEIKSSAGNQGSVSITSGKDNLKGSFVQSDHFPLDELKLDKKIMTPEEADKLLPSAEENAYDKAENEDHVANTATSKNSAGFALNEIMAGYSMPPLEPSVEMSGSEKSSSSFFTDPREEIGRKILSSPTSDFSTAGKHDQMRIASDKEYSDEPDLSSENPIENIPDNTPDNACVPLGNSSGNLNASNMPLEYIILGEAYNCYIIVQLDDRLVLIDKHAAHERIIFDRLQENLRLRQGGIQTLMFPLKIFVTEGEAAALSEFEEKIRGCGFDFEVSDSEVSLTGVPDIIDTDSASDMLQTMLSSLAESTGTVESIGAEYFEKALYRASCKAAVKGGRVYGDAHIRWICDRIMKKQENGGYVIKTCPHGRPVAFEIKKSSIERQFSRIT